MIFSWRSKPVNSKEHAELSELILKLDTKIKEYMESHGLKELLIPGNRKIKYETDKKIKLSTSK